MRRGLGTERVMMWVLGVVAAALVATLATAASPTPEEKRAMREADSNRSSPLRAEQVRPRNVTGTIQYDPGAPQDLFRGDSGGGSEVVVNRFNSNSGDPLKSADLTAVSFFPASGNSSPSLSFFGTPNPTGSASRLQGGSVTGVVASTFNVVNFTAPIAVPNDFLAGLYVGTFNAASLGMRTASTNAQGFHAAQISFDTANNGDNFTPIAGQNAMFRASGDILVPVELMTFQVE